MKIIEETTSQRYVDGHWHVDSRSTSVTPFGVVFFLILILTFVLGLGFASRVRGDDGVPYYEEEGWSFAARERLEALRKLDASATKSSLTAADSKVLHGTGYRPTKLYSERLLSFVGGDATLCDVGCGEWSPPGCAPKVINRYWRIDHSVELDNAPPVNPSFSRYLAKYGPKHPACKWPGGGQHGTWLYELELREGCLVGAWAPLGTRDCVPTNDEVHDMIVTTSPAELTYVHRTDDDRDGLPNDVDACPLVAGVKPNGCPRPEPAPTPSDVPSFRRVSCKPCPGVRSTGVTTNTLLSPEGGARVEVYCPCGIEEVKP